MIKKILLLLSLIPVAVAQSTVTVSINGMPASPISQGPQLMASIPTPPSGAYTYSNMQAVASNWIACAQACAGGGPGITSVANVSSPSLSGNALKLIIQSQNAPATVTVANGGSGYAVGNTFSITQSGASGAVITVASISGSAVASVTVASNTGSGYSVASGLSTTNISGSGSGATVNITGITTPANSLFYDKTSCPPLPNGCVPNHDLHIIDDYYEYFPTESGIQAFESDPDIYDGVNEYFNSDQCDSVSGMWRLWNMGANTWITTSFPCTLLSQPNVWHHVRTYTIISRLTGYSIYQAFEFDGVTIWSNLGERFPFKALSATASFIKEFQIDTNSGAGFNQIIRYVDNVNVTVW